MTVGRTSGARGLNLARFNLSSFARMDRVGRRALALLTACAVALVPAHSAATAQNMSRADYEACQARDEAGFRSAIEAVTTQALQRGLAGIDYKAIVAAEWQRGDV